MASSTLPSFESDSQAPCLTTSLKSFDKNSADKIQSKKDKEIKVSFRMPIMVNKGTELQMKMLAEWGKAYPNKNYKSAQ